MNQAWLDWTRANLARGCDAGALGARLRARGYTERDIFLAMGSRYPGTPPAAGDYRRLASPRLVQRLAALGGKRHPDARLQLYLLPDFLAADMCQGLMALIDSRLRPSTTTTGEPGYRTSQTCDLGLLRSGLVAALDGRIEQALGISNAWAEATQGQRYGPGEEFKTHTDYFKPGTGSYRTHASGRGQRSWTFMIYLNAPEAGGETRFTRLGIGFAPRPGLALVWHNLDATGQPNPTTEHQGLPVSRGSKYIVTKWFRELGPGPMQVVG